MAPKRSYDLASSTPSLSPSAKRQRRVFALGNAPQTPRTPRTPLPKVPADSPTNPFTLPRRLAHTHTLPAPTPFGKHIALRFQMVGRGLGPRSGGVYRIVQVPLTYTFIHLRWLIRWLFGGDTLNAPHKRRDQHLFEVVRDATMYSPLYKPGALRDWKTCMKLSDVRDPCGLRSARRRRDSFITRDGEGPKDEDTEDDGDDEETQEWKWQPEEEYTIAHAWPNGIDGQRGIIYYHSHSTQIHISCHDKPLEHRKGRSNSPFVFYARGDVGLEPNVAIRHQHQGRTPKTLRQHSSRAPLTDSEPTDADAEGETDSESVNTVTMPGRLLFNAKERMHQISLMEDPSAVIDCQRWNAPDAFATYFESGRTKNVFVIENDDPFQDNSPTEPTRPPHTPATPGLTHSPSTVYASSPFPIPQTSSSVHTPSSSYSSPFPSSSSNPFWSSPVKGQEQPSTLRFMRNLPLETPAPPRAHARQMERVKKRMDYIKSQAWMRRRDEVPSEEEVDELEDDTGEDGEGESDDRPEHVDGDLEKVEEEQNALRRGVWDSFEV